MAERISAEIWIGGKIPAKLVAKLCNMIAGQGLSREWGGPWFEPADAKDLLDALRKNAEGVSLLWLCDQDASWGQFPELEDFLQRHQLPYSRICECNGAYDAETVEFRPGRKATAYPANTVGEPVVEVSKLLPVSKTLAAAVKSTKGKSAADRWALAKKAYRKLRQELPPELPPLPPFEIEAASRRKSKPRRRQN